MVAALGLLIPGPGVLTAFGIPLTTAAGGLTLAGTLLNIGGAALLNSTVSSLFAPDAPRPDDLQINSKNTAGPRYLHYGRVRVGGNQVFHRAKGGTSYRVIVHGHGEIHQVKKYFLNNKQVSLDGSGYVTSSQYVVDGKKRVRILVRKGQIPESHYSQIKSKWSAWSSDHRGDEQWSSAIFCESVDIENQRKIYPNDLPLLTLEAETRKVYDPRSNSTVYSDNAALCIADYIGRRDGFNRPDAIDQDDLKAQADICDALVSAIGGGSEKQFLISGTISMDEEPQNALGRMLAAIGGHVRMLPNGKVVIRTGAWEAPTVTLRYEDFIECEIDTGPDILDRYNTIPAKYVAPDLDFTEVDARAWRDDARFLADGQELTPNSPMSFFMNPSHRQVRQVMRVYVERDNPLMVVSASLKPRMFEVCYERVVEINAPEIGVVGYFEVSGLERVFENGRLQKIQATFKLVRESYFEPSADDVSEAQIAPAADVPEGVPTPSGVVASGSGIEVAQGSYAAGISVAFAAPPYDSLLPIVKVTGANTSNWRAVPVSSGATSVGIPGLTDNQLYDVSVAFLSSGGSLGPEVIVEDVKALAVSTSPAAPSAFSVADNADGTAKIAFTTAASVGLWKTEIYRDGVLIHTVYASATAPGNPVLYSDACGAGAYDWFVRSVNVSNMSADSASINQTIT